MVDDCNSYQIRKIVQVNGLYRSIRTKKETPTGASFYSPAEKSWVGSRPLLIRMRKSKELRPSVDSLLSTVTEDFSYGETFHRKVLTKVCVLGFRPASLRRLERCHHTMPHFQALMATLGSLFLVRPRSRARCRIEVALRCGNSF